LHDATGAQIAFNDDWQTDSGSSTLTFLNIAPTSPKEAALYRTLLPGAYTIVVRGRNNTTGVALAEVYDVDSGEQPDPRLANISTRGRVETGDSVMIGGFIVSGPDSASILARGIGPSLAGLGVADSLGDPQLDLYDGQGTKMASNDNWRDTQ